jgi:hypothetical protein
MSEPALGRQAAMLIRDSRMPQKISDPLAQNQTILYRFLGGDFCPGDE